MSYFFDLDGFSGSGSGLVFGGLPLPGTLRMASRADLSYRASFVIGFMSALKSRIFTVFTGTPRILAISDIVYPSILIVSEYIRKILKNIVGKPHLLYKYVGNMKKIFIKSSGKITFYLDYMLFMYYI